MLHVKPIRSILDQFCASAIMPFASGTSWKRSVRKAQLSIVVTALACGTPHANAQVSRSYLVVASGHPLDVAAISNLYPNCTTMGRTQVNLVEAPHGGVVQVGEGRRYPGYVTGNPRSACNKRKVPSTIVTYRSMPGFVGQDSFVIEKIYPYGVAQRQRFTVEVR